MQCEDITSLQKMENVYLNTAFVIQTSFCPVKYNNLSRKKKHEIASLPIKSMSKIFLEI